ncbi:hypothetical protein B0187_03700 [Haemophilus paracuniculus]|uniref:Surface protein n=1 Tax=Haemophilus paracuniculus TaxID=734 RepID=A0A1T0AU71_9PAST|nr:lysine exporter LysO family protein [Haemophilus paracuniculus]OOR99922.1 hypothetical protein B0187_03700 [Haemophilus paracuniculus]
MLFGLSIVFIPLVLGYLFRFANHQALLGKITMLCLYLILLAMGISVGQLDDLTTKLPQIGAIAFGACAILFLSNVACIAIFDLFRPLSQKTDENQPLPSRLAQLWESLQLCLTVFAGVLIGFFSKGIIDFPLHSSTYVLVVMIFCVGSQLRSSGIPLREVFINKRGWQASILFIVSCLLGGVVLGYLFDLPMARALAIASGFGWYSLSSVLLNDAWGAVYGSIAFFNDLAREILCLLFIPFLMKRLPSTAVSVAGATAMDCTLPIIQKSGGIQIVPFAMSFGVIINLAAPILLAFFIGVGS